MTCGCQNIPPHYSAQYTFSCIGCYARWVIDAYVGPKARLSAIETNGRHDVELLKAEVLRKFEKRKK